MGDPGIQERVTRLIKACRGSEALVDYLWVVMEEIDDGVARDEVVRRVFGGDLSLFTLARAQVEDAWREAGEGEPPSTFISETLDRRLVMFKPARDIVYELLNED
jgi:hypothetical protein